ncbi:MAG: c-type cytochrome biogenesis protein CcmI [Pseudomonadota bacterium]
MAFWIALSALFVISVVVLVRPLIMRPPAVGGGDDREVYAAQLDELSADLKRGLIAPQEAEAARAEIARRLLRAGGAGVSDAGSPRRGRLVALGVFLFVGAFSVVAYGVLGSPQAPDQPLSARLQPMTGSDLASLVEEAEVHLAANPNDGEGWSVVAPIYQRLGRFDDARDAYARAIAVLGESARLLTGQAESMTVAQNGNVSEDARALFERALSLDPSALSPAIFLAVAARQSGNVTEATMRWRALLERSRGDEPWLKIAAAEFERLGINPDGPPTPTPLGGPAASPAGSPSSPAGLPQGAALLNGGAAPPMVAAMVERLQTRLTQEGGSGVEWAQLVRSYAVLGQDDNARATVEAALAALTGDELEAFRASPDVTGLLP